MYKTSQLFESTLKLWGGGVKLKTNLVDRCKMPVPKMYEKFVNFGFVKGS